MQGWRWQENLSPAAQDRKAPLPKKRSIHSREFFELYPSPCYLFTLKFPLPMELELVRTCFTKGSNGSIYCGDTFICHTIELPWKNNERGVSCIPEGRYQLEKRYSPKFKWHLLVKGVTGRSVVLIHPANDALKELKGCIAPVSTLTGEGKGLLSKNALTRLTAVVYAALQKEQTVFITIKSKTHDN
jgi:hypothetical protein